MPSPEENMANALERAAKFRAEGREDRAATWEAAADRYKRILDAKTRIETASKNVEVIKQKVEQARDDRNKTVTSGPNKGWYQITTSRPSAACPSGHERVEITYMDGVETGVRSLGCYGDERQATGNNQYSESFVDSTPLTPSLINTTPVALTPPPPPAKTAPIDTVLFDDDTVPIEVMADIIFENIGGQELINIARNDIINGQQVSYSPIKNLTSIQQQYNPNNIINLQYTSDKYFANFAIKLDQKIPSTGSGPNGSNVYIEPETGDLIIETINTKNDEQLDIQIVISGTIYEADI
jgi:hypothetical protein